jgi:hypothetical protein
VQHPISENINLAGTGYNEGHNWNRNAYHKSQQEEKYEKYANNTAYHGWLCVRMTLRIMQYLASKRLCQ